MTEFTNSIKVSLNKLERKLNKKYLIFFNMANPANRKIQNSFYKKLNINGLLIQNYDTSLDFVDMIKKSSKWV